MEIDLGSKPSDLPKPERFYFKHPKKVIKPLKQRLAELGKTTDVNEKAISWVFKSPYAEEIIARLLIKWQEADQWHGIDVGVFLAEVYQKQLPGDQSILAHMNYSEVRRNLFVLCRTKTGPDGKEQSPFLSCRNNSVYPTRKLVNELKKLPHE